MTLTILNNTDKTSVKTLYYNLTDYKISNTDFVVEYVPWSFSTDSSWKSGEYKINAFIKDRLSGQTAYKSTFFTLT